MTTPPVYSIRDFRVTSDMLRGKVKNARWWPAPCQLSPEVSSLIHDHPEGLAHFAIWQLLQACAMRNAERGGRWVYRDGTPMTTEAIAREIELPEKHEAVAHAIRRLCEPPISLMIVSPPEAIQRESGERPEVLRRASGGSPESVRSKTATTPEELRTRGEERRGEKSACSAPREKLNGHAGAVMTFATKGGTWNLTVKMLSEWRQTFAPLDVDAEVRKASAWCEANPRKRKTARGMPAFLTRWLSRAAEALSERADNNGDLTTCRDFSPEEAEAALLGDGGRR